MQRDFLLSEFDNSGGFTKLITIVTEFIVLFNNVFL